ncbi:alpha-2-macroglobulin family protein [Hymenobacter persicinus]|uniref:Macroglobulin domain-containing protein n=1 Tax=Hymenobacter persicinus TaxID=2025506 RepID=A0A4Q5LBC4_9BACT|nr:hypothetical protein [Hymenobacter persicinus]RYU79588.1 hypothetical protein EWM57_10500 [Hymenobacter persicinus]
MTPRLSFIRAAALLLLLGSAAPAQAQSDSLASIRRQFGRYQSRTLAEKLFLHLDRSLYVSGEMLWFKVYSLDGNRQKPLDFSKVAYVEVLSADHKPVLQGKIALQNAVGQGSFALPASLPSGTYTVRAYTSRMRNFSPELYFSSPLTIVNTMATTGQPAARDSAAYDLQFFPEGGNLVQNLPGKVGFKITGRTGRSVAAEGVIVDQNGKPVTQFKTFKYGLGSFPLLPTAAGATYSAVVKVEGRRTITRKLPAVFAQGYVLHLEEAGPDQLRLSVQTNDPQGSDTELLLLVRTRHQVVAAPVQRLQNGQTQFVVSKQALGEGVSHFTLFNSRKQPLCERLYFQAPRQQLGLTASTGKPQYTTREKVALQVTSSAPANLSLAVYRLDSLSATASAASMQSYLWLASELKGTVENPDYYLSAANPAEVREATENLLLTHGWSRFRWEDVFAPARALPFVPEMNGHLIRGSVTDKVTKAPAPGIPVYLAAPSRLIQLYTAISRPDGAVQFEAKNFYGPKEIIVQTNTRRDTTYRLEIADPFSEQYPEPAWPTRALSARLRDDLTQRHVGMQVQNAYFKPFQRSTAPAPADSLAFYGKASEKFMLDDYTRFTSMEEVLREYVPGVQVRRRQDGFHFEVYNDPNNTIFDQEPMILLDGMPVFNTNRIMRLDPLRVQKLEVVRSRYFQGQQLYQGVVSYTTYKGDLAGFPIDPHALVQEYEGLQLQREFYAPQYATDQQKQSRLPDFRDLLYWQPVLVTTGKEAAPLEFYTSDQTGRYVVVVQGISPQGLAGSGSFQFEVKAAL